MIAQNCFKGIEEVAIGIPTYYAGSREIASNYICEMIDIGMYAVTFPQAVDLLGGRNIIQIHRDLPGSTPSSYRILLTKKMNRASNDPELLHQQIEFYVPQPHLFDKAKEHFLEYVLNADDSQICYNVPSTASVTYRKITLPKETKNKLESALFAKYKAHEFYIIVK